MHCVLLSLLYIVFPTLRGELKMNIISEVICKSSIFFVKHSVVVYIGYCLHNVYILFTPYKVNLVNSVYFSVFPARFFLFWLIEIFRDCECMSSYTMTR